MSINITVTHQKPQHQSLRESKRWLLISLFAILLLSGQSAANLLERLYFHKGGKSKWIEAFVQSAGFPLLLPLQFYFQTHAKSTNESNNHSSKTKPKPSTMFFLYLAFGVMLAVNDLMYAYGLLYLHLSTYAIVSASQLGFNAIFSFFLNSQKFTALIFNTIILLTMSVSLLAINTESDDTKDIPRDKQILGFFLTLAASATFSLHNSLVQVCFEKVMKTETFCAVLNMILYPCMVSSSLSIVGLFASGEWKSLNMEMKEFENGRVSYVMTLLCTAVAWQVSSIGMLGLIFEVSALFSIVIGTLELPISPILAFIIFDDKINGVKVMALMLAIWGFLSYMYQHFLDGRKAKQDQSYGLQVLKGEVEI